MLFQELNQGKCKAYAVGCEQTRKALLIDPERQHVGRYLGWLAYKGYQLDAVLDTHTHADHLSGSALLSDLTGARSIMSEHAPNPRITEHVQDGSTFKIGTLEMQVLYTPGHTPDSISVYTGERVFSGDVILIHGTGRTDFPGGDAGQQYDSITQKLFKLPEKTLLYPAHDYRGNTVSTIGDELRHNPRLAGKTREQYIEIMAALKLPLPDKIQEVLQPNQTAVDDDLVKYPDLVSLNAVRQLEPADVLKLVESGDALVLDVREPQEYHGELGHIRNSRLLPLIRVAAAAQELEPYHDKLIICICRSGVRSTTAAAILTGLGFERVANMTGGMLAWQQQGLPAAR